MPMLKATPRSTDNSLGSSLNSENPPNIFIQAKYKDDLTKSDKAWRSFHLGLETFRGAPNRSAPVSPPLTELEAQRMEKENGELKTVFAEVRRTVNESPNMDHIYGNRHQKFWPF